MPELSSGFGDPMVSELEQWKQVYTQNLGARAENLFFQPVKKDNMDAASDRSTMSQIDECNSEKIQQKQMSS